MKQIHTDQAPEAIGPYAQAVQCDGWLYTSGQIGLDPTSGDLVDGSLRGQATQVLANLEAVLAKAGCSFADVVKTTIYLIDLEDFVPLNRIYGNLMGEHRPARSTVQVAALPRGALVEIDMVARIPEERR